MPLLLLTQGSESVQQKRSSYFTTLATNPTAAQKPAAGEANTTRVRRQIRGVVSELTIRHRGQAERAVPAHIARLRTITNRYKRDVNPLCSYFASFVVLAAAVCDSIVTARACCHGLPISVPDHHHAASLLFSSGSAAGIAFAIFLPIPF